MSTQTEDASVFPARYELAGLLGRGGGGQVWAAQDRASGRRVALKVLNSGHQGAEVEALIRETTTLSGLEGWGFPKVLHLGRAQDGRLFLVRELVEGESFEKVQVEQPRRALSLLCVAASALAIVHRAGLLHGDIKPANLIVREDGSVALVDLGLAIALREGGESIVGLTPHFAAPEVKNGHALTAQAEVYSFGVILCDLLAEGGNLQFTERTELALHSLAARSTHWDPQERFPSVDEFAQALRAALGGDVAMPPPWGPPWPVCGWAATAYQFNKCVEGLAEGESLGVAAPRGSGCSTLMRRAAWEAALGERAALYIDDEFVKSGLAAQELEELSRPGILLFVDAEPQEIEGQLTKALKKGARLIQRVSSTGHAGFFIPPLELPVIREIFRAALPAMSGSLVAHVVKRVGGTPGALRAFAQQAEGVPVGTEQDIDRILSGTISESGSLHERATSALDRGHYAQARVFLEKLKDNEALSLWLWARYELAAGSAAQALKFATQALQVVGDEALKERIGATAARAHLGLGDYQKALSLLKNTEHWQIEARAEGLAYQGLAFTFLGQNVEALESLKKGLQEARKADNLRILALVGSSLATAQLRAGDLRAAEDSYRGAMAAAQQGGDSGMLASAQINLAGLLKERGDVAGSIEQLESAVDAARRAGRTSSVLQALLNLTNLDLYLGRCERARMQIARVESEGKLPATSQAQLYGLRGELFARSGDIESALSQLELCAQAWEELGRNNDASEALLESILIAADISEKKERSSSDYMPSLETLQEFFDRGQRLLGGEENALLFLARARIAHWGGEESLAESSAQKARALAEKSGKREWAWRAAALEADLLCKAGLQIKSERARSVAVEILEEIGARLPHDLREVYWSEPRRRKLRRRENIKQPSLMGKGEEFISLSGTDAISRLSMTPLERRLARVLAINSDLAGEVDLERLGTKIVAHACELLSAERGYLLLGTSAEELIVCASRGGQGEEHRAFSRSLAGEVLSTRKPLVSIDAGRDKRLLAYESVHLSQVSAVACVPVLSPKGAAVGALYIETRSGARPRFGDEITTLQAFADQAAIALENSRLISQLQEKTRILEERNRHLKEARASLKELLGKRTTRLREVRAELRSTKNQLASHASYGGMVGTSALMRKVYSLIERVKDTNVSVLITGESGTGKEVAARAIYEGSLREKGKMLAVNCGAIPESILESELFGHVRGAFTGADRDRKGLFREAEGGVLLLDEIGETPLKMQASLLRVLQEKKVRPVGGKEEIPIDVRVIFATNKDLKKAVATGEFREDLLYRIQVVELALPALRDRQEDIPLLCDHFIQRFSLRFGQEKKSISREALAQLVQYSYPGNIRQLENILLNAWIFSDQDFINEADLSLPSVQENSNKRPTPPSANLAFEKTKRSKGAPSPSVSEMDNRKRGTLSEHQKGERSRMVEALEETGWNRAKAATLLGMARRTFYRRLRDYKIQ